MKFFQRMVFFTRLCIATDDRNILSRTSEVLRCLEVLNECSDGETVILPFVTHTFEEVGITGKAAFTYLK